MKKIFLSFLFCLCVGAALANGSFYVDIRHLTINEGLSSNAIRQIYQDSKGFMWFGSINSGLARYDGYSFTSYLPVKDKLSLVDSRVKSFQEDNNHFLWILTSSDEVCCYDLAHDCFVDFSGNGDLGGHYGYIAFFGEDVWLWGRTQGCRKVSYTNGRFSSETFTVDNNKLPSDRVSFVMQGTNGRIWIGTEHGLCSYKNGQINWWNENSTFQWMRSFGEKDYFVSRDGRIWLAGNEKLVEIGQIPSNTITGELLIQGQWYFFTSKGGFVFNPVTYSLNKASQDLDISRGLVRQNNKGDYLVYNGTGRVCYINAQTGLARTFEVTPPEKAKSLDERYSFVHDSHDIVWISTHGSGLYAYDLHNNQLEHYSKNRPGLQMPDILLHVMEDSSGCIWVGSEYEGAFQLKVIRQSVSYLQIQDESKWEYASMVRMVEKTKNGEIWLCARDGKVHVYTADLSKKVAEYKHYLSGVYAIAEDANLVKWVGTKNNGLYIGDKHYVHNPEDHTSLGQNSVFCIQSDRKGRMWVGILGGGLNLAIKEANGEYTFRRFFSDSYSRGRIRSLLCDKNGWIWAGTNDGVIVFQPDELLRDATAYHYYSRANNSLKGTEVRTIYQDSKGDVWLTQSGAGFCICTPQDYSKLTFKHYSVEDGLVNNLVESFVEDEQGQMWIPTEFGISCFDQSGETFKNFRFSEHVLGNTYCENAALRLTDGRIIAGTHDGLAIVDPLKVNYVQQKLSILFTDLKVNGVSVVPGEEYSPITNSMAYENTVRLQHNQNSLSVNFSTMNYANFTKVLYRYLLEGYDRDWSVPSDYNVASYKNLPPGHYTLRVQAQNTTGEWNGPESTLDIIIQPPFWRTPWCLTLFVCIGLAILYVIYRFLRKMNKLRNEVQIEKQLTEYKLVFFTNISHEFRTPLTLILNALERIQQLPLTRDLQDSVRVMDKGSKRLMRLVNQLLEFRKMSSNKLVLSLEETDVIAYLHEIYLIFKDSASSKRQDLSFLPSIDSYKMFIDKGNLDKVAYNLLSNALKYTPSGGQIEFRIEVDEAGGVLRISVTDTGIGIPKDKVEHLFSRFMQSRFLGHSNSMGVGLNLTYELVTVHKGTLEYAENPGGGSVFTVTLSLDSSAYEEKDFLLPNDCLLPDEVAEESVEAEKPDFLQEPGLTETEDSQEPINSNRILIIEDDADIRELIKKELGRYFDVVTAVDGESGLDQVRSDSEIELIVCDVMMPGISGFEVTKQLKDDFSTCHIPIILLTALDSPQSHLEGIKSGADSYITKPFSTQMVLMRCLRLIEQRKRLREKYSNDPSLKSTALCSNDKDKEFVKKLDAILERQLDNSEFTAEDFAAEMGFGRSVFYSKVRGITGYSPKEYIRILRMKKAAELLLTGNYTAAEVTYMVGISDPSYFAKCFKSYFGVLPKAYGKQAQGGTPEKE